ARAPRALAHDPEKACPALDAGWIPIFGKIMRQLESSELRAADEPRHDETCRRDRERSDAVLDVHARGAGLETRDETRERAGRHQRIDAGNHQENHAENNEARANRHPYPPHALAIRRAPKASRREVSSAPQGFTAATMLPRSARMLPPGLDTGGVDMDAFGRIIDERTFELLLVTGGALVMGLLTLIYLI